MSFTQDLIVELQRNEKLDSGTRGAIADFLQQHATLIDAATDDVRQAFFTALGKGDSSAAWDALSAGLNSSQILEHLRAAQGEMVTLAAARQAAVAQLQATLDSAGAFAFHFLAQAALALL